MTRSTIPPRPMHARAWPLALAGFLATGIAGAATTDLATTPLFSSTTTTVKPNVMFILDDSGSMGWAYMPDDVVTKLTSSTPLPAWAQQSAQCNGIAYNPVVRYTPPVYADGSSYPNASFTAAKSDGYCTGGSCSTTDLTGSVYYTYSGSQPAVAYTYINYLGSIVLDKSTTFFKECHDSSYASKFTSVTVSSTSGPGTVDINGDGAIDASDRDERQNYANWFSYYRTRMLMMKTSVGIAFKDVDDAYRLGFMTIHTSATSTGTDFLDIGDFTSDGTTSCTSVKSGNQKQCWYKKLYGASPGGGTPLKPALSKAGRIYAGKIGTDPVQYSCQQNFTILSTDGYWNSGSGYREDGITAIGDQDNNATATPRPLYDGNLGASDTLADVASYYYRTDLRPAGSTGALGTDVSANNVPGAGTDTASWQHMTTFTLGLGVNGAMKYSPTYETDTSGDFYNVKNGTVNSASSSTPCSWVAKKGTCNWPVPTSDDPTTVDDLWHAAVNGHGLYVSAKTPQAVKDGLTNTLARLSAQLGSAAAATTSNPNVSSGDNYVFSSTYVTEDWTGELMRQQIDLTTGALSTVIDWVVSDCKAPTGYTLSGTACSNLLDAVTYTSRKIYTYDPTNAFGTKQLKLFSWSNLTATEQGYFSGGADMVNFLRGDRSKEGTTFRIRKHVLGDIVSSEAVYVKKPLFNYADAYYGDFKTANASRQAVVYVGANDGMLHAFNATNGAELWAYIPSLVLPQLYKLASPTYAHQFYVDGSPVTGDVCATTYDTSAAAYVCPSATAWKTILVGGLNAGGRGLYALDVTDPANPVALWEFTYDTSKGTGYSTSANLGYTFGNPVITKRADGKWVVLITSGYNNVSPGDGEGRLFMLDALTGAILAQKSTGVGDTSTPSGLARISAWADSPSYNNTAKQVYGGDLLGNLWRFDMTGGSLSVLKLAELTDPSGNPQPITARPELGNVSGAHVVYIGTGRMLGTSDLTSTQVQSFYAIKDGAASLGPIRGSTGVSKYTISTVTDSVTGLEHRKINCSGTCTWADFTGSSTAWFFDFPDSKERATTDPALALGTLVFTTNIPDSTACFAGGSSWIYYLDYKTGKPVATSTSGYVGDKLGNALATRPVVVQLPGGGVEALTRTSKPETKKTDVPVSTSGSMKRIYWREIFSH